MEGMRQCAMIPGTSWRLWWCAGSSTSLSTQPVREFHGIHSAQTLYIDLYRNSLLAIPVRYISH